MTLVEEPDSPVPAMTGLSTTPRRPRRHGSPPPRPDIGLLLASLVIACGGVLIVWGMTDALTGDDGIDRPAAIESVSPVENAVQVLQQEGVAVDFEYGYEARLFIDGRRTADHAARPGRRRPRRDDRAPADRRVRRGQRGAVVQAGRRCAHRVVHRRDATRPRSCSGAPTRARTPPAPTAGRSTSSERQPSSAVLIAVGTAPRPRSRRRARAPPASWRRSPLQNRPGSYQFSGRASSSRPIRWYVSATSSAQ